VKYRHVSSCPKCGAPIYEVGEPDGPVFTSPPKAMFTCKCRKTLPASLPDVDGSALETTGQADRRTLARSRLKDGEPGSEERTDD